MGISMAYFGCHRQKNEVHKKNDMVIYPLPRNIRDIWRFLKMGDPQVIMVFNTSRHFHPGRLGLTWGARK